MRQWMWALIVTGLLASPAQAVIYWDDGLESDSFSGTGNGGSTNVTPKFNPLPNFPESIWYSDPGVQGPGVPGTLPMTRDTAIKFDGSSSVRYNYTQKCQTSDPDAGTQSCGGSTSRNFPYASSHFGRVLIRPSAGWQWSAGNGQSKLWGVRSTQGLSKIWFNAYFSLGLIISAENTPANGSTTNLPLNMTMTREVWNCVEWEIIANNPPGTANGQLRAWLNGSATPSVNRSDISWRGVGNDSYLDFFHLYRQSGGPTKYISPASPGSGFSDIQYLHFDRIAIGTTRIGCPAGGGDTTAPATPAGWIVR